MIKYCTVVLVVVTEFKTIKARPKPDCGTGDFGLVGTVLLNILIAINQNIRFLKQEHTNPTF